MDKKRLFVGIILFGSLWGFSEVILGSMIADAGFPSGGLMAGFFAIPILIFSRMIYKQPGMQLGMGFVAGTLRIFNPFVGCQICSAISIMAEGALFELIFTLISTDFKELKNLTMQSSIGVFSAYIIFVGGYIVTQILTPIVAGAGFYLENLIVFIPRIFASGIIPALIAAFTVPLVISVKKLDISIQDKIYYPTTVGISLFCWIFVIGSWALLAT
jgi:hypothetical protein